jgi:ribosomal protein S27E
MTTLPVTCPGCRAPWPAAAADGRGFAECPQCRRPALVEVFPALLRGGGPGEAARPALAADEATCFYHPAKQAAVACDACGRLVCALCDLPAGGRHLCPGCLERSRDDAAPAPRVLYGRLALLLALIPLFIFPLAALAFAAAGWRKPGSLVRPRRWQLPAAVVIALLNLALTTLLVLVPALASA